MYSLDFLLIVAALVCFALAALNVSSPKISLTPLGLFLWLLTLVVP